MNGGLPREWGLFAPEWQHGFGSRQAGGQRVPSCGPWLRIPRQGEGTSQGRLPWCVLSWEDAGKLERAEWLVGVPDTWGFCRGLPPEQVPGDTVLFQDLLTLLPLSQAHHGCQRMG